MLRGLTYVLMAVLAWSACCGVAFAANAHDKAGEQQAVNAKAAKIALPSFAPIVDSAMPAVVNISTTQKVEIKNPFEGLDFPEGSPFDMFKDYIERDFSNPEGGAKTRKATSLGSGFIIDAEGFIVTNYHVVAEADEINVTLSDDSEKSYKAKVIGKDSKTDLALLKIDAKKALPFLKFVDADTSRVGDWVIAIGNPFGLGISVSSGIVSAKARFIPGQYDDFIQTDAPINRGNSGGPMININGEVIGVNSVIISPSGGSVGIGLAIPAEIAQPIIKQLKEKGSILRGWLGVKVQYVTEDIAKNLGLTNAKGALVSEVIKDSPSEKSGIKVGDVITKFDDKEINNMQKLPRLVAETPIGKTAKVELVRDGKVMTLETKIEKPEGVDAEQNANKKAKEEKASNDSTVLGMKVESISPALRTKYKLDKSISGVVVTKVVRNSISQINGIKPGDVIMRFNRSKTEAPDDLSKAVNEAKKSGAVNGLFLIHRDDSNIFFVLDLE
jgi:serine protease Do